MLTCKDDPADRTNAVRLGAREDDSDDSMGWLLPSHLTAIHELDELGHLFFNDYGLDSQSGAARRVRNVRAAWHTSIHDY